MLQDGMLLVNEETHSWLVFASTVGIDFERRKMKKNRFTTTQLAIAGLMIALTIILSYQNIYLFPPRSGRITLRFIPMIFSGIILGPTLGTIIGGASDPLIYFMTLGSPGMYFPGYMLTNMIMGFFPGLILGKNIENDWIYKELFEMSYRIRGVITKDNYTIEWINGGVIIKVTGVEKEKDMTYRVYWEDVF